MRKVNRILAFIGVGFVLVFMAKISKADLFHAFTRTLEPLELRNSVAVDTGTLLDLGPAVHAPHAADIQAAALPAEGTVVPDCASAAPVPVTDAPVPFIRLCQGMPPIRAP